MFGVSIEIGTSPLMNMRPESWDDQFRILAAWWESPMKWDSFLNEGRGLKIANLLISMFSDVQTKLKPYKWLHSYILQTWKFLLIILVKESSSSKLKSGNFISVQNMAPWAFIILVAIVVLEIKRSVVNEIFTSMMRMKCMFISTALAVSKVKL